MSEAAAKDYERQMNAPDLIFLTKENGDKIKSRISPEVLEQFEKDQEKVREENQRLFTAAMEKAATR